VCVCVCCVCVCAAVCVCVLLCVCLWPPFCSVVAFYDLYIYIQICVWCVCVYVVLCVWECVGSTAYVCVWVCVVVPTFRLCCVWDCKCVFDYNARIICVCVVCVFCYFHSFTFTLNYDTTISGMLVVVYAHNSQFVWYLFFCLRQAFVCEKWLGVLLVDLSNASSYALCIWLRVCVCVAVCVCVVTSTKIQIQQQQLNSITVL